MSRGGKVKGQEFWVFKRGWKGMSRVGKERVKSFGVGKGCQE